MDRPGRRRPPRPHRWRGGLPPVADLPALETLRRRHVRQPGAALQPRSGLLHLQPPLAPVPARVALLVAGGHHVPGGHRVLPVGRDPTPGAGRARAEGGPRGARAPLGAAGPHHAGEGVGLLPRTVRPPHVQARRGGGGVVHGREGPAPRAQPARDRGGDLRDLVLRQHPRARVGAPHHRGGTARRRLRAPGNGLPLVRAAVQGRPAGVPARTALHRGQHRGDAHRLRAGQDRVSAGPPGRSRRDGQGAAGQRPHHLQHPALAPAYPRGELPVVAADPPVLRLPRRRRGSLPGQRQGAGADGVGPRGHPAGDPGDRRNLAEPTPGVHARLRRRGRAGELGVHRGRARVHGEQHPARVPGGRPGRVAERPLLRGRREGRRVVRHRELQDPRAELTREPRPSRTRATGASPWATPCSARSSRGASGT